MSGVALRRKDLLYAFWDGYRTTMAIVGTVMCVADIIKAMC